VEPSKSPPQAASKDVWTRVACVRGDLTRERVDAIVNAANTTLRGGGGVDGAIHAAAGPELLAECIRLHPDGCPTGAVRVTRGFRLPARFVIHAVGPIWRGGTHGEPEQLAARFDGAVAAARELRLEALAFAAISCGVYGYPWEAAADVSLSAIARALERDASVKSVRVVLFGDPVFPIFTRALARLRGAG
jgi:O-acetyl-ADP-ribose deacetylase (regulator of RNase III)